MHELSYILGKEILGAGIHDRSRHGCFSFLLNKVGFKEIKATYVSLNPGSGKSWKGRNAVCKGKPSLMPFNAKDVAEIKSSITKQVPLYRVIFAQKILLKGLRNSK